MNFTQNFFSFFHQDKNFFPNNKTIITKIVHFFLFQKNKSIKIIIFRIFFRNFVIINNNIFIIGKTVSIIVLVNQKLYWNLEY